MILGSDILYNYIFKQNTKCIDKDEKIIWRPLIENFPRDGVIEGCSPDLRLKEIMIPSSDNCNLFINERRTVGTPIMWSKGIVRIIPWHITEAQKQSKIQEALDNKYTFVTGSCLVSTMEIVNLGQIDIEKKWDSYAYNLYAEVKPRMTLIRSMFDLRTATVNPNYQGNLTFMLTPMGENCLDLEIGTRFCNITFHTVVGEVLNPYGTKGRGYWQGNKKELQGKVAPPQ